jgi:hypothetical protein
MGSKPRRRIVFIGGDDSTEETASVSPASANSYGPGELLGDLECIRRRRDGEPESLRSNPPFLHNLLQTLADVGQELLSWVASGIVGNLAFATLKQLVARSLKTPDATERLEELITAGEYEEIRIRRHPGTEPLTEIDVLRTEKKSELRIVRLGKRKRREL